MSPFNELVIIAAVAMLGVLLFAAVTSVTRSFRCPITGDQVTAHFRRRIVDGRLIDVEQCSAFRPTTAVVCAKTCLRTEQPRGGAL